MKHQLVYPSHKLKWVGDCCLTPKCNFQLHQWQEQVTFQQDNDEEIHFVLDQHA